MNWFSGKSILVPVDFSAASLRAVDVALEMADNAERVSVLHVLLRPAVGEPGLLRNVLDEATARDEVLAALEKHLPPQRYAGINLMVAFGNPVDEIVEAADSAGVGLIVMPSHGRTGLAHLLLGNVAERVTRQARCPVMILRD
jgi:nucleotide-binding universal stress UspA family protein